MKRIKDEKGYREDGDPNRESCPKAGDPPKEVEQKCLRYYYLTSTRS